MVEAVVLGDRVQVAVIMCLVDGDMEVEDHGVA
jgi:hypothetical protein